jgi:uncharacterized membrane protein
MIQRLAVLATVAAFSVTAPAAGGFAPAALAVARPVVGELNPAGTYDLQITAQGNAMAIQAVVAKNEDGTFGGTVTGDAFPPLTIKSVAVADRRVKLTIIAPDGGDALVDITVDENNDVDGQWSMAGDGSRVTGKKIS